MARHTDPPMPTNITYTYSELLCELESPAYRQLLEQLRYKEESLRDLEGWHQVLCAARQLAPDSLQSDAIWSALLRQRSYNPELIYTALLAGCYPFIIGIYKRRRSWDKDSETLWNYILVTAWESLRCIDPEKRPEKILRKILNDTSHRLYQENNSRWKRISREASNYNCKSWSDLISSEHWDDAMLDLIDHRDAQQRELDKLSRLRAAAALTETEFHILVGRRIYGRLDAEQAEHLKVTVEAAKKRRQRAESVLRRVEHGGVDVP